MPSDVTCRFIEQRCYLFKTSPRKARLHWAKATSFPVVLVKKLKCCSYAIAIKIKEFFCFHSVYMHPKHVLKHLTKIDLYFLPSLPWEVIFFYRPKVDDASLWCMFYSPFFGQSPCFYGQRSLKEIDGLPWNVLLYFYGINCQTVRISTLFFGHNTNIDKTYP